MVKWLLLLVLLLAVSTSTVAKAILGCAFTGAQSHHMSILRIGRELSARGHSFTLLLSSTDAVSIKTVNASAYSGLQIVTFAGPSGVLAPGTEEWAAAFSRDTSKNVQQLIRGQRLVAESLFSDRETLPQLKSAGFDLFLRDTTSWPCNVLSDTLHLPSVEVLPLPLVPISAQRQGYPNNPAYIPQLGTDFTPEMRFIQRLQNYIVYVLTRATIIRGKVADERNFAKKIGQEAPSFAASSAALIVTTDWAIEFAQPVPPRVHMVGSVLAEDSQALTADLSRFVESGMHEGHGAVFASLGTLAAITPEEVQAMATGLSALPNPVLWKLDSSYINGTAGKQPVEVSQNVKIVDWAPQNDILGHPAVQAFVTHAGLNSIHEAVHHAKPVVAVPLIADQPGNAVKAQYHGFGVIVKPDHLVQGNGRPLQQALHQVLTDPSFKANAVKVCKRQLKPRHSAQLAADVVEHALLTEGENYLQTHLHALSWWQLSLLDVKAFLAVIAIAAVGVSGGLVVFVCKSVVRMGMCHSRSGRKQKLT